MPLGRAKGLFSDRVVGRQEMKRITRSIVAILVVAGVALLVHAGAFSARLSESHLDRFRRQILTEFMRENPPEVRCFIAGGYANAKYVEPSSSLLAAARRISAHCESAANAKIDEAGNVLNGQVYSVIIRFLPEQKVYEFGVGTHSGNLSGHGRSGKIWRTILGWVWQFTGTWIS
jgi:hypothetical protein